jgi:hypothetical protein
MSTRLKAFTSAESPFMMAAMLHPVHAAWVKIYLDGKGILNDFKASLNAMIRRAFPASADAGVDTSPALFQGLSMVASAPMTADMVIIGMLHNRKNGYDVTTVEGRARADAELVAVHRGQSTEALVRAVYAAAATSASAERAFSCAGLLDHARRYRLNETRMEKMVVIAHNLRRMAPEKRTDFFDYVKVLIDKGHI